MFEVLGIFFLLLILAYPSYARRTTKQGAPFVPMEPEVVSRVMEIAEVKKGENFYELGSGDGRLVIAAALKGANAVGVELDFFRYLYSSIWIYFLRLSKHAKIIRDNFFNINLSDADIVCLYLLPETTLLLEEKLEKELKKGTKVVSVAFEFPNWKSVKIDPRGTIYGPIYLYIR